MTTPFPFVAGSVLPAQSLNDITNLPINNQTASYSLVVGDAGKRVVMNVATANTVTVDDDIFSVGDTIFIANKGAGVSTITAGAGVTINSASGQDLVANQSGQLVALSASSFLFFASEVTSGKIVQVVSGSTSTAVISSSTTFVNTLLTATITPTSASNKILITVTQADLHKTNGSAANGINIRLVRNSTSIQNFGRDLLFTNTALFLFGSVATQFLDSPATTSATTYKTQFANTSAQSNVQVQSGSFSQSFIILYEVTP